MNDTANRRSLKYFQQGIDAVTDLTPKERRQTQELEFIPIRIQWGTVRTSQAILKCLDEGFLSEAVVLLRSLMFDVHRLIYLEQNSDHFQELLISYLEKNLNRLSGIAKGPLPTGSKHTQSTLENKIQEKRQNIELLKIKFGIKKCRKFPAEGANIAKKIGRDHDLVGHNLYAIITHDAAWNTQAILKASDGEQQLYLLNKEPKYVAGAAASATEYLFEGTVALAKLFHWNSLADIEQVYSQLELKFKAHLDKIRG